MTLLCRNVTAIIKTFERPASLRRLMDSLRRFYPDLPVIIVDDSATPAAMDFPGPTRCLHPGFDIGLAAGRNCAVREVTTPYTLLLDDDFVFTRHTRLEALLEVLTQTPFQLVGGRVIDFGHTTRVFEGQMKLEQGRLILDLAAPPPRLAGYPRHDFVLNFFMARTELLRTHPWADELKIREHEEFFWRLKMADIPITALPRITVEHYPELSPHYAAYRLDRVAGFDRLACARLGVSSIERRGYAILVWGGLGNAAQRMLAILKLRSEKSRSWNMLYQVALAARALQRELQNLLPRTTR